MLEKEDRLTAKTLRPISVLVILVLRNMGIIHVSTGHFDDFILRQDAC